MRTVSVCVNPDFQLSFLAMLLSVSQKIIFFFCLVLCVALFLPKLFISSRKQGVVQSEVGPGNLPPSRYSHAFPQEHEQWQAESIYSKAPNSEAKSRNKKDTKRNLISHIIPVYGFGIFLYIIYIFVKLTCKDRLPKQERRVSFPIPESTTQEISANEMVQHQSRSSQVHGVTVRRESKAVKRSTRSCKHGNQLKQSRLQHLRKIVHVMVEGRSLEGVSPEVEAEETPYYTDWEGYPEETYPQHEVLLHRHHFPNVILEEPLVDVLSPEELAERIEKEEEDEEDKDVEENNESDEGDVVTSEKSSTELEQAKEEEEEEESEEESEDEGDALEDEATQDGKYIENEHDDYQEDAQSYEEEDVGEDHPCLPQNTDSKEEGKKTLGNRNETEPASRRRHITFSNHKHVFHYPKGGVVGCSFEDEEVEENTTDHDDDDDDADDDSDDDNLEEELKGYRYNDQMQQIVEVDPLMEAESLDFNTQFMCDPEDQEVDLIDFLHTYQLEAEINQEYPKAHDQETTGCTTRNRKRKTH